MDKSDIQGKHLTHQRVRVSYHFQNMTLFKLLPLHRKLSEQMGIKYTPLKKLEKYALGVITA